MDYFDWFVPPDLRDEPRVRTRHRGITKALLTISLVVTLMLLAVALLRGRLSPAEYTLFAVCIVTPVLGALLIRATASITLGLVATNLGGILIVTVWAFLSGGILSIALPAFLANIALLGTFGNVPIHAGHGGRAGSGAGFPLPGYDAGLDARVHGRGIRLAGIDADLDAGFGGDRGARGILSGARPRIGQDAIA
jgi:hypothetical protein